MKRRFLFLIWVVLVAVISAGAQTKQPKTVREFFMALPGKYFSIDCCGGKTLRESKESYLKEYLEIEDTANGYLSAGGSAAQDALVMALFKRSDGSYLIAVYTAGEGGLEDTPWTVFLDYKNGKWTDVSRTAIPNYDKKKYIYELPREGTTIEVFQKEETDGMYAEDMYKGRKLYDLTWKNGKFTVKQ